MKNISRELPQAQALNPCILHPPMQENRGVTRAPITAATIIQKYLKSIMN